MATNILYRSINMFFQAVNMLILMRIVLSWVIQDPRNPIMSMLYQITEPILAPCRELIKKLNIDTGMIDFSPIVAMLLLSLARNIIVSIVI